jgi:flagellar motor switch protein FliN/FliY
VSQELTPEEANAVTQAMGSAAQVTKATAKSNEEASEGQENISRVQFMQLEKKLIDQMAVSPDSIARMYDLKVKVEVVLGEARMTLSQILRLQEGNTVELNRLAGEAVDLLVNGKLIAKAEIVVIDDNFGVKVVEIIGV